jgi:hypothetical protein
MIQNKVEKNELAHGSTIQGVLFDPFLLTSPGDNHKSSIFFHSLSNDQTLVRWMLVPSSDSSPFSLTIKKYSSLPVVSRELHALASSAPFIFSSSSSSSLSFLLASAGQGMGLYVI